MKKKGKKKRISARPSGSGIMPSIRREIRHLLSSEEAKISARGLLTGTAALITIGITAESLAGHYNQHASYAPHASLAPHHSVDCGHDSIAVHQSASPHVSVAPHNDAVTPHTNTHASVNEAVTKGTFHNNVADGYGKHSANVGHNNNPNIHTNTSGHTNTAPHYHYWAHGSTAPHVNTGVHASYTPHYSQAPHHNMHHSNGSY